MSEMLANDLARWPSLSVIAREALGPVLREQWLQQRGFSSSTTPVELGHIQGVHYLVRGSFSQFQESLIFDLQIVDVETGVIVGSLRAQGDDTEIPQIEHDLVMQIIPFFESDDFETETFMKDEADERLQDTGSPSRTLEGELLSNEAPVLFAENSIHQIDMQLSLERMTQQRIQAYQTAKVFWRKSWSTEIGQPVYRTEKATELFHEPTSFVSLPFSIFMQPHQIRDVLGNAERGSLLPSVRLVPEGLVFDQFDEEGVSQLFAEQVRRPHRLFVRAANERDEVIAVYSKWSWQSDALLEVSSPEKIVFPVWPQPLLRGLAEFPVSWVERGGQHATFDLVMASNLAEQRTISLEPIDLPEGEDADARSALSKDLSYLLPLKNWILKNWMPPIAETLPVSGYLPANKQMVIAFVYVPAGTIERVQFLEAPHDPLFSRSLEELKSQLLGYCLSCQLPESHSFSVIPQTFRLQLTLVKDLSDLRLGSPAR